MQKKVIVIEDSTKSGFGGGQRVTLDFIDAIVDNYSEITVIDHTKGKWTPFKQEIVKRKIKLIEIFGQGKIGKNELSSYSFSFIESLFFPFFLILNICILLNNYFRISNESIIFYAATKKALVISRLLAKQQDRIIFHAHSLHRQGWSGKFFQYLLQSSLVTVVGVSNAVGFSYNTKRFIRVYNGVAETGSTPKLILHKPIVVAYIGSLISWKGVDYFLSAIDYLSGVEVLFHVYGVGNLENTLKNKWHKNGKIVFKGFVKDINYVLSHDIDILVLPSVSEEACPMTILEAFSHAIPVITTNIGGQSELLEFGGGICVQPRSSKDIADAIKKIASEDYLCYSSQAHLRKREFSIDIFKNSFLNILNLLG